MQLKNMISGILVAAMLTSTTAFAAEPLEGETTQPGSEITEVTDNGGKEEAPVESQPGEDKPEGETPDDEQPGLGQPDGENPDGEQPGEDKPEGETPDEEQPGLGDPDGEEPDEEQPDEEEPSDTAVALRKDHVAYMDGYGNGKFGPYDKLTWAQVCNILYGLLEDQSMGEYAFTFRDVPAEAWYYEAVSVLASRGILTVNGDSLHPNSEISRGDFLRLVMNLVGVDEEAECHFPDLSPSDSCYAAVATAVEKGWIQGLEDGTFGTNESLSRAQAVTVLNKVLNRKADSHVLAEAQDLRAFTDVKTTSWCYADVLEATIDHTGTYSEFGEEVWTEYTPSYPVTFNASGVTTVEMVYDGDCPVLMPKTNASGVTITRWVFPNGTMKDPANTPIHGATYYMAWYAPALITDHSQYISGFDNGTFQPSKTLSRAETAQILYNLLVSRSRGGYPSTFTDVTSDKWYAQAVTTLASLDVITGGGAFRPNDAITRGEFVEMVTRLKPLQRGNVTFTDVDEDSPYYAAISSAVAKGWVSGYSDGTFQPDGSLTRAEAVTIFNRILGRIGDKGTASQMDSRYTFTDVPSWHWAYVAIMEAATSHTYTVKNGGEEWSTYTHSYTKWVDWNDSASVVAAASITNSVTPTYNGDYTHNYNWDYSQGMKEAFVNGYSSSTDCLIWVSRQNQKVYIFQGKKGDWNLIQTFLCATGKVYTPTPVGVTTVTYRQNGWFESTYTVAPVVRFYPGSGYAFHSRLYYPGSSVLKDGAIGYPASHGCVRMLTPDVTYIYNYIPSGTTVVVY